MDEVYSIVSHLQGDAAGVMRRRVRHQVASSTEAHGLSESAAGVGLLAHRPHAPHEAPPSILPCQEFWPMCKPMGSTLCCRLFELRRGLVFSERSDALCGEGDRSCRRTRLGGGAGPWTVRRLRLKTKGKFIQSRTSKIINPHPVPTRGRIRQRQYRRLVSTTSNTQGVCNDVYRRDQTAGDVSSGRVGNCLGQRGGRRD
jgi:hypothetical protein